MGPQVALRSELSYRVMDKADFGRTANRLELTQALYRPDLKARERLAQAQTEESQAVLARKQLAVRQQLANAVLDRFEVRVRKGYLIRAGALLADMEQQLAQRQSLGQQRHSDWAGLQARLAENQVQLAENQQAEADVIARLSSLLSGLSAQQRLTLRHATLDWQTSLKIISSQVPSDWSVSASDPDWSQWVQAHPDMTTLRWQTDQTKAQGNLARSLSAPKVEAFGGWVYNESDGYFYDDMQGGLGGIRVEWPFYRHGEQDARLASARSEQQALNRLRHQRRSELMAQADRAWHNLRSQQAVVKASNTLLKARKDRVQALSQDLETEQGSILALLTAQIDEAAAHRDRQLAQAKRLRQWVALASALGRFDLIQGAEKAP
jgi:outer membrane protein